MKLLAVALVSVACCAVIAGIGIGILLTGAEAGYAIITAGALGIMAGSILCAKVFLKEP